MEGPYHLGRILKICINSVPIPQWQGKLMDSGSCMLCKLYRLIKRGTALLSIVKRDKSIISINVVWACDVCLLSPLPKHILVTLPSSIKHAAYLRKCRNIFLHPRVGGSGTPPLAATPLRSAVSSGIIRRWERS